MTDRAAPRAGRPALVLASSGPAPSRPVIAAAGPRFLPGTRVATPHGEAAVEWLRPGDLVLTLIGERRPVVAVGRGRPARQGGGALPVVRVAAHAFGRGMPERDLLLEPEHAIYMEGVLVPAGVLADGCTVTREAAAAGTGPVHLALATHDVLLAEDLPVESCPASPEWPAASGAADGRPPTRRQTSGPVVPLHRAPELLAAPGRTSAMAAPREARCAELVTQGAALERVRARLALHAPAALAARGAGAGVPRRC